MPIVGRLANLFVPKWDGPPPEPGDVLIADRSSQTYLVERVSPSSVARYRFVFRCLTISRTALPGGKIWAFSRTPWVDR